MSREQSLPTNPISLTAIHPVSQGISLPKLGTLIPNRIFVGGISSNTTEEELRAFFSVFGAIKDVKVIYDKSGLSKGSYGFVTFEDQQTVESVIKNEAESLIFKDRKLNIGYAVRKQHIFQKHELGSALLVAHNPCSLANGLSFVQLCPHDHSVIAMNHQPAICYPATVMIPSNPINHHFCAATGWTANSTSNPPTGSHLMAPHPIPAHQFNPNCSATFLTPRTHQAWGQETGGALAECERAAPKLNAAPFTPTTQTCSVPTFHPAIRSHQPTHFKPPGTHSTHGDALQWFASVPRFPNSCHSLVRQPHAFAQNVSTEFIRTGSGIASTASTAELPPSGSSSYSTPTAPAQFGGGCDVGFNSAKGQRQTLPESSRTGFPFTTAILAPCGTHCTYHTEPCPSMSHVTKTGNTSDMDKLVYAASGHDPRSCPACPSSAADGAAHVLIRRILQTHACESKPDNTQSTVGEFSGVGGEGATQLTDKLSDQSTVQPTKSCAMLDSTVPPVVTKNVSPGSISSYCFPKCTYIPTSDSCGYEQSLQLDKMFNDDTSSFKSYPLSGRSNYGQQSSDRSAEPLDSSSWFEPLRPADPFAPRRLFGMDFLSSESPFDLSDRAECKRSTPLLLNTGTNATTACGDISKQRQD